jgi:rod shape-determining protein MreC
MQWVSEAIFLSILIWFVAQPLSPVVLNGSAWVAGVLVNTINTVTTSRDLAARLLQSSKRVHLLETQLADTKLEMSRLVEQSSDAENLRALLGLRHRLSVRTIAADIVGHNPDNWFSRVTLNKGTADGITTGSAVVTNNGAVGQVVSSASNSSVVRLLTDPDQTIGILIPRINQVGVLSGRGSSPPVIQYVSVEASVEVGDKVVSLGNAGVFPAGHPVGVVSAVRHDTSSTSLTIEVRPSENYYDLAEVLVLPPAR